MDPSKRKYCTRQNQKLPMMEPGEVEAQPRPPWSLFSCEMSMCVCLCVSAKMKIRAEGAARHAKRDCVQPM